MARLVHPFQMRSGGVERREAADVMTRIDKPVEISMLEGLLLEGNLTVPENAKAIVLFAHGSGSGRASPRNRFVARAFNRVGLATLLFDLLTPAEDSLGPRGLRFDIDLLASRLVGATDWVANAPLTRGLRFGYFGASTGAAAALAAAAQRPALVGAVVCRGGRPDLALDSLAWVEAPTRLVVGGEDREVLKLNESALARLRNSDLVVVPGATHLFEETDALQKVANLAAAWFSRHLLAVAAERTPDRVPVRIPVEKGMTARIPESQSLESPSGSSRASDRRRAPTAGMR
jgi:pimeloyl-ACP methyl ester carboxylesterase